MYSQSLYYHENGAMRFSKNQIILFDICVCVCAVQSGGDQRHGKKGTKPPTPVEEKRAKPRRFSGEHLPLPTFSLAGSKGFFKLTEVTFQKKFQSTVLIVHILL